LTNTLPALICPFVQTADIEIDVTSVTRLARHIMAVPSPKILNQAFNMSEQEIH
jgi:hypothetical protein